MLWRWSSGAQNIIRVCYTKMSTVEFFMNITDTIANNERLIEAAMTNNNDAVQRLVGVADICYAEYEALGWALRNNNADNVRAVLSATHSNDIPGVVERFKTAKNLRVDVLKVMVEYLHNNFQEGGVEHNQQEIERVVLFMAEKAIDQHNTSALQYLVHHCDPNAHNGNLLRAAAVSGHDDMISVLYPLSNPEKTTEAMEEYIKITRPSPNMTLGIARIRERMEQDKLHKNLSEAVEGATGEHKRKM